MFEQWLDESYRAQAPKRLVKQLDGEVKAPVATKNRVPGQVAARRDS
jgi:hypothetical protein